MREYITIDTVAGLAQLARLDRDQTQIVMIQGITEAFSLPPLPKSVVVLTIMDAELVGDVVIGEGVEVLHLYKVTSEVPLSGWTWSRSLVELFIDRCDYPVVDLRASSLEVLSLQSSKVGGDLVLLPASLSELNIYEPTFSELPRLPANLESLTLSYHESITDYSGAMGAKVKTLQIGNAIPLYEYFSEVRELIVPYLEGRAPEISLTHLESLAFEECEFDGPVEINAPNLKTLKIGYCEDIDLQGAFTDEVTTLILDHYHGFPESDDWFSLKRLEIKSDPEFITDVPHLPWLKWLTVSEPVRTNGIMVSTLREYRAAWGMGTRKKRAMPSYR